jgi:hypothetical protein
MITFQKITNGASIISIRSVRDWPCQDPSKCVRNCRLFIHSNLPIARTTHNKNVSSADKDKNRKHVLKSKASFQVSKKRHATTQIRDERVWYIHLHSVTARASLTLVLITLTSGVVKAHLHDSRTSFSLIFYLQYSSLLQRTSLFQESSSKAGEI